MRVPYASSSSEHRQGVGRLTNDHDSTGEAVQDEGRFAPGECPQEDAA